jgi:hypothetical protein
MYFYQAYGLIFQSVIPLPELITTTEIQADIEIKFGKVDRSLMEVNRLGTYLYTTPTEISFFWKEVGAITVRNGKEIIIDPLPEVEERLLRLPILGIAFAVILHQRGFLPLHASAVEINGGAAVFTAGRGWGKSTLAATLYGKGYHLISDDLVAIDVTNYEVPMVIPGFPQLKLLPEAAASALGDDPNTLPPLATGYEKRSRRNIERFSPNPIPLRAIYKLGKGTAPALKILSTQEAVQELIGNTYTLSGVPQLVQGKAGASYFHQCMSVLKQVPLYRLERPQVLELVPEIAKLVEQVHLENEPQLTQV